MAHLKRATIPGLLTQRADDLITLTHDSEKDFLGVGGMLQELHQRVTSIFESATAAARTVAGSDSQNPLVAAKTVLSEADSRFRDCDDVLGTSGEAWCRIAHHLRLLIAMATRFEGLAAKLQALRVFVRIESSRTKELHQECAALAVHAGNVATRIADDMTQFAEEATRILGTCESSQMVLEQSRRQYSEQRQADHCTALDAMKRLDQLFEASGSAAAALTKYLEKVQSRVGNLVSSLQCHDIFRQQIEHIADAFRNIAAEPACAGRGAADPPNETRVMGSVRVQQWQLRNVAAEIDQAADGIRDSLREVSETLDTQAHEVDSLLAKRFDEAGDIDRLGEALNASSLSLQGISRLSAKAVTMVSELTTISKQMEGWIHATQSGASTIHILALNAQISAARLGGEGRAIDIISQDMGRLSSMVKADTQQITSEWHAIAEEVASLRNVLGTRMTEVEASGRRLSSEAAAIPKAIRACANTVQEKTQLSVQGTTGLCEDIARMVSGVCFDETARPLFQEVESELNEMLKGADVVALEKYLDEQNATAAAQADHYTMERERRVHRAALQATGSVDTAVASDPAPVAEGAGAGTDPELGDNVELF